MSDAPGLAQRLGGMTAWRARLGAAALAQALGGVTSNKILGLHSAAGDRTAYLQRPDLGRRLDDGSRAALALHAGGEVDLCFVIADGLSALAGGGHVAPRP